MRVAEELIVRERVHVLMGTFASHVGLAVASLAGQRKVLFLASEDSDYLVGENILALHIEALKARLRGRLGAR